MAIKKYTYEQIEYLKEIADGRYIDEITQMMNEKFDNTFTEAQVKNLKSKHKIKSNVKTKAIEPKKLFTQEQEDFIYENLEGKYSEEIAEMVNEKFGTCYTDGQIVALKGRRNWNSGLTGHFSKGRTPWNKGMKGINIGGEETQFKKGHKPHNWVPIGSERITKDGYIQIKIQEGKFQKNWKGKHILIWEEHHKRQLPKGYAVIFGDGDNRNFDINNLILVSRSQLLYLNRYDLIKNSAEITKVAVTLADIDKKLNDRKRDKQED